MIKLYSNENKSCVQSQCLLFQEGVWPEECFELRLVQRLWWEHFIDSSLLWLFTPKTCWDVDGTNAGHAVEEQVRSLSCQDAGEGKQTGVREAKKRGVEVTVDDGCYGAVIVAGELVKGRCETLKLDSRANTGLKRRRQHYDVIQFWAGPCGGGEAQLVLEHLPCRTEICITALVSRIWWCWSIQWIAHVETCTCSSSPPLF